MTTLGPRRVEQATAGGWRAVVTLLAGMVFRMFESDGTPVVDGEGVSRWRAVTDARPGEVIQSEAVPESDAEQAVRETGMFWPGGPMPRHDERGRGLR